MRAAQQAARDAERRFPVRIRIAVPPEGFGTRLDQITKVAPESLDAFDSEHRRRAILAKSRRLGTPASWLNDEFEIALNRSEVGAGLAQG
jgi:hypothetical protein